MQDVTWANEPPSPKDEAEPLRAELGERNPLGESQLEEVLENCPGQNPSERAVKRPARP